MDEAFTLDYAHSPALISVRDEMQRVLSIKHKSFAAQFREMTELALGPGRLAPSEYYYFGLYDDERFSSAEKRKFVGLELQTHILRTCTNQKWWALAHDKATFYSLMHGYDLPVPRVDAIFHPHRVFAGARALRGRDDAGDFLRRAAVYPLFSKPLDGMRSVGSARLDGYDQATDELLLYPHRRVAVDAFTAQIAPYWTSGYLFQPVQRPHPDVAAVCGDRLATVRLVVIMGRQGPEPFRAVWKIPAGSHVADNYWRKGNLLAGIDIATGRVTRVMTGVATHRSDVLRHPDTGKSFHDLVVPDWHTLKSRCLEAAVTMPGISLQGWDVAPCAEGPILIEVNIGGDFTLPQLGNDRGMLDDQLSEYLVMQKFHPRSNAERIRRFVGTRMRWRLEAAARSARRMIGSGGHTP